MLRHPRQHLGTNTHNLVVFTNNLPLYTHTRSEHPIPHTYPLLV